MADRLCPECDGDKFVVTLKCAPGINRANTGIQPEQCKVCKGKGWIPYNKE